MNGNICHKEIFALKSLFLSPQDVVILLKNISFGKLLNFFIFVYSYFKNSWYKVKYNNDTIISIFFSLNRARGYPEPVVTWRREDGNEIILKDSSGTKTHGMKSFSHSKFSIIQN